MVDQAHRPQAGTHEGEDRRGKDHLFLSNATDPQHVKAVSNQLESEAASKMNHSTDGEWSLRLWRGTVMVSSGHWKCTLARVRRCRLVWRCPENHRWDRKPLTEMDGEPWNTLPRQEEKLQIKDRECIALKHLIKCGGQKGSMTCCEHAGSNLRDLRARTQDIVDNEVVQTDNQRKFERLTKKLTK